MFFVRPEIVEESGRFVIALGELRFGGCDTRLGAEIEFGLYLQFHETMRRAEIQNRLEGIDVSQAAAVDDRLFTITR